LHGQRLNLLGSWMDGLRLALILIQDNLLQVLVLHWLRLTLCGLAMVARSWQHSSS